MTSVAMVLAIVGLSSCAGYTSAAKTTTGDPGAGVLSASATSLSFGSVAVGNATTQSLSVTNTGTATVTISQATLTGAGFSVTGGNPSGSIPVGQSSTIQIQFAPTAGGAVTGSLTVISDASNSPLTISLTGTGTQAGLTIAPSALTFSNVVVGQTSTKTVQLTNTGTTDIVINVATVTGNGFGISGLTLPTTLTGGQSLSFSVQFAPTAAGAANGSITFTDNAPASPQTVALVGSGVSTSSTLTANPGSLSFGNVSVGSNGQQTITLTNSGNTSATISAVSATGAGFTAIGLTTPLTLSASQSTTFTAQFAPTTAGIASGAITITSTANDPTVTIPLTGTGVQGSLAANPSSVNFGSLLVGASASVNVILTNSGTASITISQGSASGTGYSLTGLSVPATLAAGKTTTFTAKFSPSAAGTATGSISISSTAPGSPLTIPLTGSGTAAQPQLTISPASVSFGNVAVGSSAPQSITLTNAGNATLTVSQATASGSGFSMSGATMPMSIAAGGHASFTATFAPTSAGAATGSISVVSNAPGSPAAIAMSGTGIQGQIGASPASVNFGSVGVGSSGTQTITLTNSGTASVTISQATASGSGFSISGLTTPKTLGAGLTTTLTAKLAPTSAGNPTGSISIVSNAPGSPLTIALSGTATQPQLAATPSSAAFGNVVTGTNNSQTIDLTNGGTASVTITAVTVTGTGFSTSGISTPLSIAAGKSATFNAVFAPTSAGAVSGSVSLTSNAPNSPLAIALSGTGVAATKVLGLSTSSLSFGNVNVGSNSALSVALTNNGNANVTISNVGVTGAGFSESGVTANEMLTPNQSVTVTVTFAPGTAGAVSGSVSIASNATNSPATINVSGTGVSTTPHTVALNWTASSSTVSGYNVYRGTTPNGPYPTKVNPSLVTIEQYSDSTVASGQTYYYVVTAVDSNDVESVDSNQATAIVQ
ncbi:MAG: choice-of-anchor D domain-containing protein [Candidatus Acidiferrales bacterium]